MWLPRDVSRLRVATLEVECCRSVSLQKGRPESIAVTLRFSGGSRSLAGFDCHCLLLLAPAEILMSAS